MLMCENVSSSMKKYDYIQAEIVEKPVEEKIFCHRRKKYSSKTQMALFIDFLLMKY